MWVAHSPLVEPDVKVSLIRLSEKFPTAGRRRRSPRDRWQLEAHAQKMLRVGFPLWWAKRSLASPSHVAIETAQYEVVDLPVSLTRAPKRKVVSPAFQVSIQLSNQAWQGFMTL